jgi:hypothetical protein
VACTAHPALKFHQNQLVRAIDQGKFVDAAVPLAAMVEGEEEILAAKTADF